MIRYCIFPVAGLGTRFLPATKELPKEMVPLLDKPLIHYGVEEALNSGCQTMIMVSSRSKRSLEDYFDINTDLEKALESKNKTEMLQQVKIPHQMAKIVTVRQPIPLGLGHAVLCAKEVCNDPMVAIILPDDVMIGNPPILKQLIDVHNRLGGSVIALEEVPHSEVSRYGIISGEKTEEGVWKINDMIEKPSPETAPTNLAIMGRYVLSHKIFDLLENTPKGAGGEIQLTDAINALCKEEPVYGLIYKGERYDCGTTEGWLRANVKLAMKHPSLKKAVLDSIKDQ